MNDLLNDPDNKTRNGILLKPSASWKLETKIVHKKGYV